MASMLKNKKFWLVVFAAAGAIGWWQSGSNGNAVKKTAVAVRVSSVESRDVPLALKSVGTVVTSDSVTLKSRIDSQIMEVKFKDGDYVEKGALLFVLDDRALKAQLGEMEANMESDKAKLDNLRVQFERSKQLAAKNFASQADLDNAKAAYEAQRATANASGAVIENTKVQLAYTRITAPISGRTGTISVTAGNTVKANDTSLVVINQVKPIRVQVSLPQRYLGTVRDAMAKAPLEVSALREGGGEPSHGTLEYIDNAVDQSTGTFAARATFPNENEALWPGMFVNLILVLGEEKNVLTLPEVAIQHGQAGDFVFTVADGKAVKRPVKVARLQDAIAVIETGVSGGEPAVVDGLMSLTDGAAVTVKTDAEPKP